LDDRFESVGRVEPLLCVEVLLYAFDLGIERFGDEEIGSVPEVFDEALRGLANLRKFARVGAYICSE
jgi:hypothetical protein